MIRACKHCKESFEASRFHRTVCPTCKREYQKGYREKNKERIREYQKEYQKEWTKRHPNRKKENFDEWYSNPKNKERVKKIMKKRYDDDSVYSKTLSQQYKSREKILKIIGDKCSVCGKLNPEIHHKEYFFISSSKKPFEEEIIKKIKKNLIPLCRKHHKKIHFRNNDSPPTFK